MLDTKEKAKYIWLQSLRQLDVVSTLQKRIVIKDDTLIIDNEIIKLDQHKEIVLIGIGKASIEMGKALEAIFKNYNLRGILVTNRHTIQIIKSEIVIAGHPVPNQNSIVAARKIIQLIESTNPESLIIFLISGGGSAMVELPVDGVNLDDIQITNQFLVTCGANIEEINTIRKSLSKIKGGNLKRILKRQKAFAIYLSDVNPGDIGSIASGPLIDSDINSEMILDVIEKYSLREHLPSTVLSKLLSYHAEIRSNDLEGFDQVTHFYLMDNRDLLNTCVNSARDLGMIIEVDTDLVEGVYREIANKLLKKIHSLQQQFPNHIVGVISGGEVSCPAQGKGIGGRNIEFVLYTTMRALQILPNAEVTILSCGSDGIDGISYATGAYLSSLDIEKAMRIGLNGNQFLETNDSNSFVQQMGGLLLTGPSGNNIRDIRILLAKSK